MNEWIQKVKQNVLAVKRHGKLNPDDNGGFSDYGELYPNPDRFSGLPVGVNQIPRPDLRPVLKFLNMRTYQGDEYNPALNIRNVTLFTSEDPPIPVRKLVAFDYQCRQGAHHPKEYRDVPNMEFIMYFEPGFAKEFATSLKAQTVSPDIILRLYDEYFPENEQGRKRYTFQKLTGGSTLNIFHADVDVVPNPDTDSLYKTIEVARNAKHVVVPFT